MPRCSTSACRSSSSAPASRAGATVWQHVERALRADRAAASIAGTALAAYGHGDWNDALQPADPAMREHMCSAWTVTLHHQTLVDAGARAARDRPRAGRGAPRTRRPRRCARDFQRLLLVDGVLAGYALFDGTTPAACRYLLHPRDATTGVRYSALAMIHAILEDMLDARRRRAQHLRLIDEHLSGPDGVRLFDRPMAYHGGPQRFFQRAESATFFGREIGLMYMHAHLRYAQALAHVGEAERFFHALCQANPIGMRELVPTATPAPGELLLLELGCGVRRSLPGERRVRARRARHDRARRRLARLFERRRHRAQPDRASLSRPEPARSTRWCIDPVMPAALDGLRVETTLHGHDVEVVYRVQEPGHGVRALQLNGKPIAHVYETNPYRLGAARVPWTALLESLTAGTNVLTISVG